MNQNKIGNWQLIKLKDLCSEVTVGYVGPMINEYVDDGVPFLRSQNVLPFRLDLSNVKFITSDFHRKVRKSVLHPGDVVVVRTGYPGTACIVPPGLLEANCADLVIIRPLPELDPYYLTCIFNSALGRSTIAGRLVGVAQQHFNISAAKEMYINLPPLPTQRTIAYILSAYDDLIENNTRRIAILEEMARMLYEEWFVKFRFPGHEQVKMVESELGMIPEGWKLLQLGDVIELAYGKALKADARLSGNIPVYGSAGIVGYHQEKLVDGPGIVIGRKGNVGSVFWSNCDFYPIDTVFYVRTELPLYYVYYNLLQQHFINNDAAVPGLSRHQAYSLPFIQPSNTLLQRFEDFVNAISLLKINLEQKCSALRRTRDLLLPKLISGEIDVSSWAEGDAGEIVQELAIVGTMDAYSSGTGAIRKVAEAGPIEPLDGSTLERHSLWE